MSFEKTIRILQGGGQVTGRNVSFDLVRLSRGRIKSIQRKTSVLRFGEIDRSKIVDQQALKEGEESIFSSVDVAGWEEAKEDALDELTQVLWGIEDVSLDKISGDDFDGLVEVVREHGDQLADKFPHLEFNEPKKKEQDDTLDQKSIDQ